MVLMEWQPCGLATGIGSLPHRDPELAVLLVRRYFPLLPHWPQLPRLTPREGYLEQFLSLLVRLGILEVREGRKAYFPRRAPDWPERLARFYEVYLEAAAGSEKAWELFAFPPGAAEGFTFFLRDLLENGPGAARFLKGQVVGLLSVGFELTDEEGVPAYYDPQCRDVLLKHLSLQAAWQVRTLGRLGLPVLVFMDDPVLSSCGMYDRICVAREEVQAELGAFAEAVRGAGGLAGVHSCAELDWSLLLEADLDVVSFDAYQFGESFCLYPAQVQDFLARGGVIAWGLVPTTPGIAPGSLSELRARAKALVEELAARGVDKELLRARSLVTPACGTGILDEDVAVRVLELTAALAAEWRALCS